MLKLPLTIKLACWLLIAVLGTIILVYSKDFLLPIVVAALLSLLLYPVYRLLCNWKVPGVISVIITMLLVLCVMFISVLFISGQLKSVLTDFSGLSAKINQKLSYVQTYMAAHWQIEDATFNSWIEDAKVKLMSYSGDMLSGTISTTTNIFSTLVLIGVYVFCFLLYNKDFKDFAFALMALEKQEQATHI
ncbi:MAG TPA: AI-2E family transporter, partial [Bacteroidia bacterium]|nr:AI-2E family transporter [Bacteroidia bacterium]